MIQKLFLLGAILLMLCSGKLCAQLKYKPERYEVTINCKDSLIKATVLYETPSIKIDTSDTYYWYKNNTLYFTKGNYSGKILDGLYISYYASGNLKSKGNFKRGLKKGKWYYWNKVGDLVSVCSYKKKTVLDKIFRKKQA